MAKKIKILKNGPYLVSGRVPLSKEIIIANEDGVSMKWQKGEKFSDKEEYSLCRCGQSKNIPFCDKNHKNNDFVEAETASLKEFAENEEKIEGPDLILGDAKSLCANARFCDRAGGIWDLTRHSQDKNNKKIAIEEACDCPAGRLVAYEKNGKVIEPKLEQEIALVEGPLVGVSGPIWVKGKIPIESSSGKIYEPRNRVTLCRCGRSKNKPFCDATHVE